MVGKIIRIDDMKSSRNKGHAFKRVYFKVASKDKLDEFQWAKTDLVPTFRNYARWKDLLVVGNVLSGIILKDPVTVDADSTPVFIQNNALKSDEKQKVEQLGLGL